MTVQAGESCGSDGDAMLELLLPWLASKEASLGPELLGELRSEGYAVVRGVLSSEECAAEVGRVWEFVETVSHVVSRRDENTWFPARGVGVDLWPHSGAAAGPDTFNSFQAGWLLRELRETLATRVFEPLFGTRELLCSKEGFVFHRPTASGRHPSSPSSLDAKHDVAALDECNPSVSCDPGRVNSDDVSRSHCCIRAAVALVDLIDENGCGIVAWPGSHAGSRPGVPSHENGGDSEISRDMSQGEGVEGLRKERVSPRRLSLAAGDLVLWRSDMATKVEAPRGKVSALGALAFVSMLPASLTSPECFERKLTAYLETQTGDHRPHLERWCPSPPAERAVVCRGTLFSDAARPPLTWRQAELHGLVRYASFPSFSSPETERSTAESRGVCFVDTARVDSRGSATAAPVSEARVVTLGLDESPLAGQDKWLGGMASPCGRFVYGVPGSAQRVLRVELATGAVSQIGPKYVGKFKWLRGVEVGAGVMGDDFPSGACFALPSNADSVLRIDPATDNVTTLGGPFSGDWLWHGGNLAPDGCIYGIPANAERVLRIDPRSSEVSFIGPTFLGRQKWYGGILAANGAIYGIPHTATGVLKIVPRTGECVIIADGELPEGGWKWHGGLATPDGQVIYGFPNNSDAVLKIDTRTDEVRLLDGGGDVLKSGRHRVPQDGRYKYLGGSVGADGNVYIFPCDAERVLQVNPRTDELRCIGPPLLEGENKNGFRARDGCVYAIPQRSRYVLRIVPSVARPNGVGDVENGGDDARVELLDCGEAFAGCKDKFEGGVMGADGCMYCIPLRAKWVLKIVPAEPISVPDP